MRGAKRTRHLARAAMVLVATCGLAGPMAAAHATEAGFGPVDPWEGANRGVFGFNMTLDRYLIQPVARFYRGNVPDVMRLALSNFLDNLRTPVILANDLLQGDLERANTTVGRFLVNSTFGGLGLVDLAGAEGMVKHKEDFGQTLAVYGIGTGPYIMLPLFGPSNARDAVGTVVDILFDPATYLAGGIINVARTGTEAVDNRSEVLAETDSLEATALDYYATIRTLYSQNRDFEIANGESAVLPDILDEELDLEPAE